MELKNYVEILRDGRSLYQGNSDLTLNSREQRYTASEFLNLPEMLERTQGDAPLSKGNYVVRVSTVAWDYELSSLSQAKFLNMDLRPIFGPQSDEAKRLITGKAVDVTVEKQDGLLVNFFDVAQNVGSERAPKPGSDAARDAVLLSPRGSTQTESERYLADGVQRSFQEALRLQNIAASHGKPERLKVVVTEVYFPLDEDRLVAEAQTLLDNVARHLNQHPELFAEIRGFAADVGDESSNAALARKRAQRVIEYLGRQKIASYRMQFSEQEDVVAPVRPGEDARTGRKVEIALVRKGM
jgi:outer membrane protein OmpA-like peptidoglycan-associated protein